MEGSREKALQLSAIEYAYSGFFSNEPNMEDKPDDEINQFLVDSFNYLKRMMLHTKNLCMGFALFLISLNDFGSTCDDDEVIKGCRIGFSKEDERTLDCFCGVGCERTFPYRTRSHCKEAILKSQEFFDDPCTLSPCQNHGQCIPLQFGNFKCECAGTRHYGVRCEKECPTSLRNIFGYGRVNLPADCVNKM
ncbi:unnamed protein product [Lepeophtheirus salmonis]|uniref:(salmon louse) hypothetical protein n=1 Tax=Lepeophtheirus salmonis TaxID=72036 RepID=A0A7R8CZ67_LEPSM|nr:unnamed protein product [Lepeophtheirus salmonis]CAF2974118.1 unnamed protein product [Lepeophtheirus salmonis]